MAAITGGAATDPAAGDSLQPLSAEDLSILALENESVAGHTCKVIVLEHEVDLERLRSAVAGRIDHVPQLSMVLCDGEGQPCWSTGAHVDIEEHVVMAETAGALAPADLRSLVARLFEQRLDRSRPLWRIDVVPQLTGGGGALVWRIHHALADGMTAMKIAHAALWDSASNGASTSPQRRAGPPRAAVAPQPRHRLEVLRATLRETPRPWLRSPFAGRISAQRSVAFVSLGLDVLRRVAAAHDRATVNDAVLAVVAGGLRRWLELHHGHLGAVRVKVPVSLHAAGGSPDRQADPGNRDSFFCVDLPLGIADPLERLAAVHRATKLRKDGHDAQHLDGLMKDLESVPALRRFAERVLTHPRSFALNVSNVPGPREPVTVLGNRVLGLYTLAEIRQNHVLRIAVTSVLDTLTFGLVADPTLLSDVDRLASLMYAEARALVSASTER